MGPQLTEDMIDNLNIQLFEISETENTDPYTFYSQVANLLRGAGFPIKDASLMTFDDDEMEVWPEIGTMKKPDGSEVSIYLYLAYTRASDKRPFSSHAELVTDPDLEDIMRFSNMMKHDADYGEPGDLSDD
jgi:hypothetical protein